MARNQWSSQSSSTKIGQSLLCGVISGMSSLTLGAHSPQQLRTLTKPLLSTPHVRISGQAHYLMADASFHRVFETEGINDLGTLQSSRAESLKSPKTGKILTKCCRVF